MKFIQFLALLFFSVSSNAQPVGTLEDSIIFNGIQRPYSLHVPFDYNASNAYKLVLGLHGCVGGSTPSKAFLDQLSFLSDSIQAIVICPNGQPNIANGQMNEPDDLMLTNLIDTILSLYHIDSNQVFLTGFSCNGYITAKFGLREIYPFRGIIPFNGWITNNHFSNNEFDYENSTNTCICYGSNDPNLASGKQMYNDLLLNQKSVYFNEIPGIGHTTNFVDYPNELMECFNWFFEQPSTIKQPTLPSTINVQRLKDQVYFTTISTQHFDLKVHDLLGKSIYSSPAKKEHILNLSSIPKGFMIWTSQDINQFGKFRNE